MNNQQQKNPFGYPKKLDIYDNPESFPPQVESSPSELELYLRQARHTITDSFAESRKSIESLVDQWITVEKQISTTFHEYHDQREPLLPGMLWVTLGAFAGSIFSRNRHPISQVVLPLLGGVGTFGALYPSTSRNLVTKTPAILNGEKPLPFEGISLSKSVNETLDSVAELLGIKKK